MRLDNPYRMSDNLSSGAPGAAKVIKQAPGLMLGSPKRRAVLVREQTVSKKPTAHASPVSLLCALACVAAALSCTPGRAADPGEPGRLRVRVDQPGAMISPL